MATTFTNQASLSYSGGTVLSNVAVGEITGTLSISKQAVEQTYRPGDAITYIVSIVNSSDAPAEGLTVTDDLGAYAFDMATVQPLSYIDGSVQYYSDGVLQAAPAVSTTVGVVFSDINVPANGSVMLIYEALVNEYAPLAQGAQITNTATADGAALNAVSASFTLNADDSPALRLIKSVSPVPVAENGKITYTFRLENSGSTAVAAADSAVISDTFSPVLSNISVTLDGEPIIVKSGYSYDEATGLFTTAAGLLEVPAAVCEQDPDTGAWSATPGAATLVVSGTIAGI